MDMEGGHVVDFDRLTESERERVLDARRPLQDASLDAHPPLPPPPTHLSSTL
jgi:hypothetical protein